jgi:aminopeptidase N
MLERLVARSVFDRAIRRYASNPLNKTSYEDFLSSFGHKGAEVRRFARPWISEKGLPSLNVTTIGTDLLISQTGPRYWLPNVTIRLMLQDGTSNLVQADIDGATTKISLKGAAVANVELDPFEDYLLEKRLFEISPSQPAPSP